MPARVPLGVTRPPAVTLAVSSPDSLWLGRTPASLVTQGESSPKCSISSDHRDLRTRGRLKKAPGTLETTPQAKRTEEERAELSARKSGDESQAEDGKKDRPGRSSPSSKSLHSSWEQIQFGNHPFGSKGHRFVLNKIKPRGLSHSSSPNCSRSRTDPLKGSLRPSPGKRQ